MPNSRLYWNARAADYDRIPWVHDPGLLRWTVDAIVKAWPHASPPLTVLDIGCGTGALTYALAVEFERASVCGADTSIAMIDRALADKPADQPSPHFVAVEDVIRHCRPTPWDLVTARSVLHHAPSWQEELTAWSGLVGTGAIAIIEGVPPAASARDLFDYAMQLKEPGRHTFVAAEIAEHLLSLGLDVVVAERFTEDNSCRAWLAGGGCSEPTKAAILRMHLDEAERNTQAAQAYRMRIVDTPDGPDVLMRWRHAVVVGIAR